MSVPSPLPLPVCTLVQCYVSASASSCPPLNASHQPELVYLLADLPLTATPSSRATTPFGPRPARARKCRSATANSHTAADVAGLQTLLPWATMSDWGWKNDSLPEGTTQADVDAYKGVVRDGVQHVPPPQIWRLPPTFPSDPTFAGCTVLSATQEGTLIARKPTLKTAPVTALHPAAEGRPGVESIEEEGATMLSAPATPSIAAESLLIPADRELPAACEPATEELAQSKVALLDGKVDGHVIEVSQAEEEGIPLEELDAYFETVPIFIPGSGVYVPDATTREEELRQGKIMVPEGAESDIGDEKEKGTIEHVA
ncbi:hypothetical protein BD309DRAFT_1084335, partial [Dichomitus squalens]